MRALSSGFRRFAAASGMLDAALSWRSAPPVILMFHGVSGSDTFDGLRNVSQLHLPRETFVAQLRLLKRHRRVIGLTEMVQSLQSGDDLSGTVALTFDDGYENNVLQAAPVLSEFGMPASFFLATAHIGTGRWIWTDRIEHAFDRTTRGELAWDGQRWPLGGLDSRRSALRAIKSRLKTFTVEQRDRSLDEIVDALGERTPQAHDDYRFMDWHQARALADAGFEIGAHTVNHAILSQLPESEAHDEILASRDAVIAGTGACCPVFCYPNGKPADYSPAIASFCRRHFIGALATRRGPARPDEIFELARLSAWGGREDLAWTLCRLQ